MDKRDSLVITVRSWRPPSGELTSLRSVLSSPCRVQCVLNQRPSQVLAYRLQADYCPLISLPQTRYSAILWLLTAMVLHILATTFSYLNCNYTGRFWGDQLCRFGFTLNYFQLWLWYCRTRTDTLFTDWLPFCSWICFHYNDRIQSIFHAPNISQFVHLNGLKWPLYKYGPLSNVDEMSHHVHPALT